MEEPIAFTRRQESPFGDEEILQAVAVEVGKGQTGAVALIGNPTGGSYICKTAA